MASFLSDALRIPRHSMVESMELSHVPEDDWEPAAHDFNEDAANLLEQAEEKRKAEIMQADGGDKYNFVPLDRVIEKSQI
jgi:hypothetical protein